MPETFDPQPLMAMVGVGVFGLVWLGLATSIRKIASRQHHPPSFNVVLNAAHLGRFAGWALVGAVVLRADFWTGFMLITTRIPAVALVAVTFLQRRELRPSRVRIARTLIPVVGGLVLLCALIGLSDADAVTLPALWGIEIPSGAPVSYAANGLVLACFSIQILYALPQQIWQAREKPLGNLRWFQLSMLANYVYTLLYSSLVLDPLVRLVMRGAYSLVLIEQAILVVMIERAIRQRNQLRKSR
ncbi:MAG: hypothetical protein JRG89_17030 [Deltaproteobacteria bacterium]|nr:hypothetical protein [Deltaproteobacteria bacterium]